MSGDGGNGGDVACRHRRILPSLRVACALTSGPFDAWWLQLPFGITSQICDFFDSETLWSTNGVSHAWSAKACHYVRCRQHVEFSKRLWPRADSLRPTLSMSSYATLADVEDARHAFSWLTRKSASLRSLKVYVMAAPSCDDAHWLSTFYELIRRNRSTLQSVQFWEGAPITDSLSRLMLTLPRLSHIETQMCSMEAGLELLPHVIGRARQQMLSCRLADTEAHDLSTTTLCAAVRGGLFPSLRELVCANVSPAQTLEMLVACPELVALEATVKYTTRHTATGLLDLSSEATDAYTPYTRSRLDLWLRAFARQTFACTAMQRLALMIEFRDVQNSVHESARHVFDEERRSRSRKDSDGGVSETKKDFYNTRDAGIENFLNPKGLGGVPGTSKISHSTERQPLRHASHSLYQDVQGKEVCEAKQDRGYEEPLRHVPLERIAKPRWKRLLFACAGGGLLGDDPRPPVARRVANVEYFNPRAALGLAPLHAIEFAHFMCAEILGIGDWTGFQMTDALLRVLALNLTRDFSWCSFGDPTLAEEKAIARAFRSQLLRGGSCVKSDGARGVHAFVARGSKARIASEEHDPALQLLPQETKSYKAPIAQVRYGDFSRLRSIQFGSLRLRDEALLALAAWCPSGVERVTLDVHETIKFGTQRALVAQLGLFLHELQLHGMRWTDAAQRRLTSSADLVPCEDIHAPRLTLLRLASHDCPLINALRAPLLARFNLGYLPSRDSWKRQVRLRGKCNVGSLLLLLLDHCPSLTDVSGIRTKSKEATASSLNFVGVLPATRALAPPNILRELAVECFDADQLSWVLVASPKLEVLRVRLGAKVSADWFIANLEGVVDGTDARCESTQHGVLRSLRGLSVEHPRRACQDMHAVARLLSRLPALGVAALCVTATQKRKLRSLGVRTSVRLRSMLP